MAVSPHQAGQPEVSFTAPLANIMRKRSQRTRAMLVWSCTTINVLNSPATYLGQGDIIEAWPERRRHHCQHSCLQQEGVPLEVEEGATHSEEREVGEVHYEHGQDGGEGGEQGTDKAQGGAQQAEELHGSKGWEAGVGDQPQQGGHLLEQGGEWPRVIPG